MKVSAAAREREVDQVAGQPVGEPLYRCVRTLGVLDCFDDLAVARVAVRSAPSSPQVRRTG